MNLPATEDLLIEERAGVLTITINRPHKRNAMNDAVVGGIMQAFDAIADRRDIRAVVLQGADGHFCSGGDISGMKETSSAEEAEKAAWEFNRVFGPHVYPGEQGAAGGDHHARGRRARWWFWSCLYLGRGHRRY